MVDKTKAEKEKKGFFKKIFEKLDKKVEQEAKKTSCCCEGNNSDKNSCCS